MPSFSVTLRTLAIFAAISLHAFPALSQSHATQPIIIDTDIGDDIDDVYALAYAVHTPGFQILGVTTTFRNAELRAHLATRLLSDAKRSEIPVVAGASTPSTASFTQAEYAGGDHHKLSSQNAADFILEQARKRPGQVTLISIGPLVNIGAAIDRDPQAFRKLKRVVVMGGSIDRGYDSDSGVISTTPSPEWNILSDVASARKLLASGVPVYLMPLDSTQIILPADMQSEIFAQKTPLVHAIEELVRESNKQKPILFDPLTVAFTDDPALCPTQLMHIKVDDKGYTRQTPGTSNANVCLKSNEAEFLRLFKQRLVTSR